jgi:hypothetical protein
MGPVLGNDLLRGNAQSGRAPDQAYTGALARGIVEDPVVLLLDIRDPLFRDLCVDEFGAEVAEAHIAEGVRLGELLAAPIVPRDVIANLLDTTEAEDLRRQRPGEYPVVVGLYGDWTGEGRILVTTDGRQSASRFELYWRRIPAVDDTTAYDGS